MITEDKPVIHLVISRFSSAAQWTKKAHAKRVIGIAPNHLFKMGNTAYLSIGKIASISRDTLLIKKSWSMIHAKISIKLKTKIKEKTIMFKKFKTKLQRKGQISTT